MPRVSIVTALYNHERYIKQAIESVLAQTYDDWEYLIWDDGSSDRGLEIATDFACKHPDKIRLFTHPGGANRGQENTRNAALEQAHGELIGLLDSDDFYSPRKLELLVPCFDDHRVGLAYGRAEFLLDSGARSRPKRIEEQPAGKVFEKLILENFVCAGATLFRRQCIESGLRFDPEFKTIGEYPLWLKIARDWEFARVPEVVATWRSHGQNLGTKLALQGKSELVRLCERMLSDREYAEFQNSIRAALAKNRYDYASELYLGLRLAEVRRLCLLVAGEKSASRELRAKAGALAALSLLGPTPNKALSKAKRGLWEWRHRQKG